ncbi:MAG TPA: glycosyltransferase, partial [Acidobacteriota bacterium]|nr:glycosyltransferase [Acidobacteriota bacterium]
MNDVILIGNRSSSTGIGTYSCQLIKHLKEIGQLSFDEINLTTAAEDSYGGFTNISVQKAQRLLDHLLFLRKIPRNYKVYHLMNPNLGILLSKYRPAVVTVHDLYPFKKMAAKDFAANSSGLDWLFLLAMKFNMEFVKQADQIISVSQNTKKDIVSLLHVPAARIAVIYLGVDRSSFHFRGKRDTRLFLNLPLNRKIVLHVGVDEPRKNINTLLMAFSEVKRRIPDSVLVRI